MDDEKLLDSLKRFPTFSYLAGDLEITDKKLDRPTYLLLEYRQKKNPFSTAAYQYTKEDILYLSNLAIDTGDKDWFYELTKRF